MGKGRLEAQTDGVIAIIITIMVLNLDLPKTADFAGLAAIAPTLFIYALSFLNVGIFWNNHHHMLHVTKRIDGHVLWKNLFLLFWLSLVPFVIRWIASAGVAALPVASYGFVLTMAAIGYSAVERRLVIYRENAALAESLGRDWKGWSSLAAYIAAMPLAFLSPWISLALYLAVAILWLVPDKRIERRLARSEESH
ncbi:MAG TPA: TMEM175 family protein [Stellaceae bacterium]|nr:TMEM175 family protein [Stellaceae bacterium]